MLVYNCDGVPDKGQDHLAKLRSIARCVLGAEESEQRSLPGRPCDIAVLLETRSDKAADRLKALLPEYTIHTSPVQTPGLKGHGIAVLVRNELSDMVQPLTSAQDSLQALWFRVQGRVFGVPGPVLFGGIYIPPRSEARRQAELEGLYEQVLNRVHAFMGQGCTQACLVGDFNAHLGTRSEFTYEHYALQARFPELGTSRRVWGPASAYGRRCNHSGKLLLDVAASTPVPLIITTGRERGGDVAQPTCRSSTRTEHVLLSPDLFALLHQISVLDKVVESDHAPLKFALQLQGGQEGTSPPAHPHHTCDATCERMSQALFRLRWKRDDPAAQACYAALLDADQEGSARFRAALAGEGMRAPNPQLCVDAACAVLMGMIHSAALDSGLASAWRCPLRRRPRDVKHQVWFDQECKEAKRTYMHAVWTGQARHLRAALRRELQRIARRSKRSHMSHRAQQFLRLLDTHHPKACC